MTCAVRDDAVPANLGGLRPGPRRRLMDAGLELFGTRGYEATTIADLCREAKVSTRDFYRHVGDRIDLFMAVFEEEADRILGPVAGALQAVPPDLVQRTQVWVSTWLGTVLHDRRRYRVLYTEAIGVSDTLDRRRREILRSSCELAASQLEICAAARGEQHPPGHYSVAAAAIMGAAREVLMQYVEGAIVADADEIVDTVARAILLMGFGW